MATEVGGQILATKFGFVLDCKNIFAYLWVYTISYDCDSSVS